MKDIIKTRISESIECKAKILNNQYLIGQIQEVSNIFFECLKNGNKIMLAGNGGSASDCLHIAGELLGRFQREREAYKAICLNADVATLTAIANDYGYKSVFARQVNGLSEKGDVFLGLSTSGNSENIVSAILEAKNKGCKTIAFTGKDGGQMKTISDVCIVVPSNVTARIQESHIMIGHIVCELVEKMMCDEKK